MVLHKLSNKENLQQQSTCKKTTKFESLREFEGNSRWKNCMKLISFQPKRFEAITRQTFFSPLVMIKKLQWKFWNEVLFSTFLEMFPWMTSVELCRTLPRIHFSFIFFTWMNYLCLDVICYLQFYLIFLEQAKLSNSKSTFEEIEKLKINIWLNLGKLLPFSFVMKV